MGVFKATMINAGMPMVFVEAAALGYDGTELQGAINEDRDALAKLEAIRAHGISPHHRASWSIEQPTLF